MANNPDSETRALLDALCEWLVTDAKFMPEYVNKLRDRFEGEAASRRGLQRDWPGAKEAPTRAGSG